MLLRQEPPLIFVHVAKTGGESICQGLAQPGDDRFGGLHCHATAVQIRERHPDLWQRAFKVGIVRDPWELCVSRWLELTASPGDTVRQRVAEVYKETFDFAGWVRYLAMCGQRIDTRFALDLRRAVGDTAALDYIAGFHSTQTDMLCDSTGIIVDHVGWFVILEGEYAALALTYGGQTTMPHINATNRGGLGSTRDWYCHQTEEAVRRYFAVDLTNFPMLARHAPEEIR